MKTIYVENAVLSHPRSQQIIAKYPRADVIPVDRYQSVFNPKSQSFRQQKQAGSSLILAHKGGQRVLPAPDGFGVGEYRNYYFSHVLNCPYDCRYCFLQGMYNSANWVLFVNYADFFADIEEIVNQHQDERCIFYSGYDGDSLALDSLTGFIEAAIPFFEKTPNATLELRTKSTQVRSLLNHLALPNVVVAFSLTPQEISEKVEHKVPPFEKRMTALAKVVDAGWPIGLRFDPMIQSLNFRDENAALIARLKSIIPAKQIHSVSIGALRFPVKMLDKLQKQYPADRLLSFPFRQKNGVASYAKDGERKMKTTMRDLLASWVDETKIFGCEAS